MNQFDLNHLACETDQLSEDELAFITGGQKYTHYAQAQHMLDQANQAAKAAGQMWSGAVDFVADNWKTAAAAGLAYASRTMPNPIMQGVAAAGAVVLSR
ncbi:MAG: hypothetical protein RL685_2830 [Pseudomonadota bacterium]|jgi:hypothetical protein